MKLTQDSLPNYFTIADNTSSWFKIPTNTFDFVDRDSNYLVVTVGDSWTWGCDLTPHNIDNKVRLNSTYGSIIARNLGADWLNLGLPASGNLWLAGRVEELAKLILNLKYQKIYVICTFTEVGRWFNTIYDIDVDYISWFQNNITAKQDFDRLLTMLNEQCVNRIVSALSQFENVTLKIGTNMVDHIGFTQLTSKQLLKKPWYQIMGCDDNGITYAVIDGIKSLLQAPEFLSLKNKTLFKEWMLDIMPAVNLRLTTLENTNYFNNYHPLARGHEQWADYILQNL